MLSQKTLKMPACATTSLAALVLAGALALPACSSGPSCAADLRRRERALTHEVDSMLTLRDAIARAQLLAGLEALRAREVALLDDARRCDFDGDLVNRHYWQQGRLRLPSRLELALEQYRQPPAQ